MSLNNYGFSIVGVGKYLFTKQVVILFLFLPVLAHGQQLTGCIKDALTNEEIPNVAVYFAGTSIGVASGMDGCFAINQRPELRAPLVFSVLGYQKLTIENAQLVDLSTIKLKPVVDTLEAVYLNPDPWTRVAKERWFKKLFLGDIPEAVACSILNLNDVRLRYNPATNLLTAVCDVPIIIENSYLGYSIQYDLVTFEALFDEVTLDGTVSINDQEIADTYYRNKSAYVAGSVFFKELDGKKPSPRRRAKRREAMFEQSVLKCFRAIVQKQFNKEGYFLFHRGFMVDIKQHIKVRKINDMYAVAFRHETYSILDSRENQSTIILEQQQLELDAFGNILTPRSIQFVGHFAKLQLAGMLPLDYGLEKL